MKSQKKIIIFLILVNIVSVTLVVSRYESLLLKKQKELLTIVPVKGAEKSAGNYTASEITDLIRKSKEYIGDTITIYDNGELKSTNNKFQGTLNAVINTPANMDIVVSNGVNNKLPIQYNIYILAAAFYRQQYPLEFK
ncbi:MAG: hypothetical protein EOO02_12175 [Chitinophagaceae bacterium]|nr:MAG: hypothetical protein EOO02_12175 [Chitinophagaceae bacterium]